VDALRAAGDRAVVIAGERYGRAAGDVLALAEAVGARFAFVTRRANDRGALRAGVHPRFLPGGRSAARARERADVEAVWGPIMAEGVGRDVGAILRACADREIDVLYLIGVDPFRDHPDADLAQRALRNAGKVIVQSLELGSLGPYADAFLPAASWIERDGHATDWEGRGQRLRPVRPAPGLALPDWEIFSMLALAAGGDLGFETLEEIHEEMGPLLAPLGERSDAPDGGPEALGGPSSAAPEPHGEGALQLFSYPLLVDQGRMSGGADELHAALGTEAFVELHPDDAGAAGVVDGGRAVVRTDAGAAELPVRVTDGVAVGTAFVPFNSAGLAANELLSGSFTTPASIGPVDARDGEAELDEPVAVGGGS